MRWKDWVELRVVQGFGLFILGDGQGFSRDIRGVLKQVLELNFGGLNFSFIVC